MIRKAFAAMWLRWYCKHDDNIYIHYASTDGDVFKTVRTRFRARTRK